MSEFDNSRRFYEAKVAPMIREFYPEYEARIAAGIAGEGSDCFGYDDFMSRDHDFGTGVCLWLLEEDLPKIGADLSERYEALADSMGAGLTARLRARRGVMGIREFYSNILDIDCDTRNCRLSEEDWRSLDYKCIATAINGEVFRDDAGEFTAFRRLLEAYYPENIWKMHIANEMHKFSSALQVNYARCMTRGDVVAARLCQTQGLEAAMELYFLMKRKFPPYYKWTYRRITEVDEKGHFAELIKTLSSASPDPSAWEGRSYDQNTLNLNDEIVRVSERIGRNIAGMLGEHGLATGFDPYLERYVDEVLK